LFENCYVSWHCKAEEVSFLNRFGWLQSLEVCDFDSIGFSATAVRSPVSASATMTTPLSMLTPTITSKDASQVAGEIDGYNVSW
jgi:hypothetical protein